MKQFIPTKQRVCKLCGDLFWPTSHNQQYCTKPHFRSCPICGKPIQVFRNSQRNSCCSKQCTAELRKRNSMNKYGVDNPAKLDSVKERMVKTNLERYGVTTPFLMDDFQDKAKATALQHYGVEIPMQCDAVKAKHSATIKSKYGVDSSLKIPHVHKATIDYYTNANRIRHAAICRYIHGKCVASDGTKLDSNYEKSVYEFCIKAGLTTERQIPIEYDYNGVRHTTFIDFKIGDQLFECKGSHLLMGCYDHFKHVVPINVKLDVYRQNSVIIITDEIAKSLFSSDDNQKSLIGINVDIFNAVIATMVDYKFIWNQIMDRISNGSNFVDLSDLDINIT